MGFVSAIRDVSYRAGAGCAFALCVAALATPAFGLEREWGWAPRPLNEHSWRIDFQYAITEAHIDDFLEFDDSYTVTVGWHYEGLLEAHSKFGLIWELGLQYTKQEGDDPLFSTDLVAYGPRFHAGMFMQPIGDLRIGFLPFVGIGAAKIKVKEKFPQAVPFPEDEDGSLWLEAGIRLEAVYQIAETYNLGLGITMVHADGDFDLGGTEDGWDIRPVQDYFTLGLSFGKKF